MPRVPWQEQKKYQLAPWSHMQVNGEALFQRSGRNEITVDSCAVLGYLSTLDNRRAMASIRKASMSRASPRERAAIEHPSIHLPRPRHHRTPLRRAPADLHPQPPRLRLRKRHRRQREKRSLWRRRGEEVLMIRRVSHTREKANTAAQGVVHRRRAGMKSDGERLQVRRLRRF